MIDSNPLIGVINTALFAPPAHEKETGLLRIQKSKFKTDAPTQKAATRQITLSDINSSSIILDTYYYLFCGASRSNDSVNLKIRYRPGGANGLKK